MTLSITIKSIQDIMRKDAGVDGDAQRVGQLGWLLFYKIFSDLELQTELLQSDYTSPVPDRLRWETWADETSAGAGNIPTGDELLELVDNDLFPSFAEIDLSVLDGLARDRAVLLRTVFEDTFNYMKNGTLLRQVINAINHNIDFNEADTRHLFGDIYEQILRDLQGAGNAGEFYTPRAVTQFAVDMVNPQPGETILDPACGTGGFLTGAYEHVKAGIDTPEDLAELKRNIRGVEKKALPHVLCTTNMMIHGIEVPSNIRHDNTLARPLRDYGKNDQIDVVLTNPPFGGMEEDGIENNFPAEFRTRETADLFLVLVMELLKDGGRAAIVLPDGTLFGEGMKARLKQRLVEECDLHTIVRLPSGVFNPHSDIKTNVLFFTKGRPTEEIWYYEHPYPADYVSYSKTKPIRIEEFEPEMAWWDNREETEHAWRVPIEKIVSGGYNLDLKNPNTPDEVHETPDVLLAQHSEAVAAAGEAQQALRDSLAQSLDNGLMNAETFLDNFAIIAQAPSGIDQLRQLILNLAVRGQIVEQDSTDESAHLLMEKIEAESLVTSSKLTNSIGPEDRLWGIPDSWKWVRLKQVVDFAPGKTPSTKNSSYWEERGGIAWAGIGDMPAGGILLQTAKHVSELARNETFKKPPAPAGTLLMSFKLTIGKVCRLGVPSYFNEAIIAIETPYEEIDEYLFRTLPLLALGGDTKAAIKGATLNKESLTNLLIPVPPLAEQHRIVAKVDEIMGLCDELEGHLVERDRIGEALAASVVNAFAA